MDDFQYIGVFVNEADKDRLINLFWDSITEGFSIELASYNNERAYKEFCDHCTLVHVSQIEMDGCREILSQIEDNCLIGRTIPMKVVAMGYNSKVAAFKVILPDNIRSMNKQTHITICTYNGGKPVMSNYLSVGDWKVSYSKPIIIRGEIRVV